MRNIERPKSFRQDFKREIRGIHRNLLAKGGELDLIVIALANDKKLPILYRDHPLHNNWEGSRECHIRSDFLLIYTYVGDDWLRLERLGDHDELFGL
ncbi:MAG: type II toxin-antitoxin system YafQ family toxin [Synergistaceae bacterium]|nr:type II toxin-antitoxin system YafQ family toxin [Synergistaceae bacterium]